VLADAHRLEEVLHNLLSNAVKYSPAGGTIRVRVARHDGEAVLEVTDEGIGIPAEAQPRLFEPFFRAGNVDAAISGFGIGLYIVHEIVQRHGGRVEVESAEGRGTAVRAVLPLRAEEEEVCNS
jgi:signal transduction histidine kinase